MVVGSLSVRVLMRESGSLKDKRQILRSVKDRIGNEFNVSIAEVADLDNRQIATIGIAMISAETHSVKKAFGRIVEILRCHPVAELLEHQVDIF